jgi:hypothetical protein
MPQPVETNGNGRSFRAAQASDNRAASAGFLK